MRTQQRRENYFDKIIWIKFLVYKKISNETNHGGYVSTKKQTIQKKDKIKRRDRLAQSGHQSLTDGKQFPELEQELPGERL